MDVEPYSDEDQETLNKLLGCTALPIFLYSLFCVVAFAYVVIEQYYVLATLGFLALGFVKLIAITTTYYFGVMIFVDSRGGGLFPLTSHKWLYAGILTISLPLFIYFTDQVLSMDEKVLDNVGWSVLSLLTFFASGIFVQISLTGMFRR